MIWKGIVGRNFTPDAFREYVAGLTWGEWQPEFIVLHNTEKPSLASARWLNRDNISATWRSITGIIAAGRAGPHVFVDIDPVFGFLHPSTPLGSTQIVWNCCSLGVWRWWVIIGEKPFKNSGRGSGGAAKRRGRVAILSQALGIDPGLHDAHKENGKPQT